MPWVYDGDWLDRDGTELPYIWADLLNGLEERSRAIGLKAQPVDTVNGPKDSNFTAADFFGVDLFTTTVMRTIGKRLSWLFSGGDGVVPVRKFVGWLRTREADPNDPLSYWTFLSDIPDLYKPTASGPFEGTFYTSVRQCLDAMLYPVYGLTLIRGSYTYQNNIATVETAFRENGSNSARYFHGDDAYDSRVPDNADDRFNADIGSRTFWYPNGWTTNPEHGRHDMFAGFRQITKIRFYAAIEGPYADMPLLGDVTNYMGGLYSSYADSDIVQVAFAGTLFDLPGGSGSSLDILPVVFSGLSVVDEYSLEFVDSADGHYYTGIYTRDHTDHDGSTHTETLPGLGAVDVHVRSKAIRHAEGVFFPGPDYIPFYGQAGGTGIEHVSKCSFDITPHVTRRA